MDETIAAELAATDREFNPMDVYDLALRRSQNVKFKLRLPDKKRNRELKKVACQRKGGKKQLYALSDDYTFVYACETAETLTFTFQEETDHSIERLPSVDADVFRDEVEHLTRDLRPGVVHTGAMLPVRHFRLISSREGLTEHLRYDRRKDISDLDAKTVFGPDLIDCKEP